MIFFFCVLKYPTIQENLKSNVTYVLKLRISKT